PPPPPKKDVPQIQQAQPKPPPPPPPPPPQVNPVLSPKKLVVVVRKFATNPSKGVREPYTHPARKALELRTDAPCDGTGTWTCASGGKVKFFSKAKDGVEIKLDGKDNVFPPNGAPAWAGAARLSTGVTVFVEGESPSAALDDITAELKLTGGS